MCQIDPYYINAMHIVSNPKLSSIREFIGNNYEYIIPLVFLGILIYFLQGILRHKYGKKTKKMAVTCIFIFVLFFFTLIMAFIGFDMCPTPGLNYYSSSEFIAAIGPPGNLYHYAVLYPDGRLDISQSEYRFKCANEICAQSVILEQDGKILVSQDNARAMFFTCRDSDYVYVFVADRDYMIEHGFAPYENKILPDDCDNNKRNSELSELLHQDN